MLVRQILSSKPAQSVISVTPATSVSDVIGVLAEHRIGAVVVSADGATLLGILSERDIVRSMGEHGPATLQHTADALMTANVVSCSPADTAVSVLEKMSSGRFRHMPVQEHGKMIGLISIGDVVKARIDEVEHENSALSEMIAGNL